MVYAGPDGPSRALVESAVAGIGFRPVWVGDGPDALATTDALAGLWFQLAFGRGWGRRLGLRLLTAADEAPGAGVSAASASAVLPPLESEENREPQ